MAPTEKKILTSIVELCFGNLEPFTELPMYSKGGKLNTKAFEKLSSIIWSYNFEDLRKESLVNPDTFNLKSKSFIRQTYRDFAYKFDKQLFMIACNLTNYKNVPADLMP